MNNEPSAISRQPIAKPKVIHFQRKPRPGFNFSIEDVFKNIRFLLSDKVDFTVKYSRCYNDGYFSKLLNILEAGSRQQKNAVLHITGETHFLNLLMQKKNVLLTIHDCRFMERKTGIAKKMMGWLYLKAPVKKSFLVTTVSQYTKEKVMYYTGCDPENIKVIPVSINPVFQPVQKKFNKDCPVILQLGAAENKNLIRLFNAVKDIKCKLVIIGQPNNDALLLLQQLPIQHTIKYNLPVEELYKEYINCDIVSFVSTYEGFGMPIAEANAVERPVITSNVTSMPEVAGDAACIVDPFDVNDIKNGILKIINDDHYREQLIENGRKNKERFNGHIIAGAYYQLYKTIADCNISNG